MSTFACLWLVLACLESLLSLQPLKHHCHYEFGLLAQIGGLKHIARASRPCHITLVSPEMHDPIPQEHAISYHGFLGLHGSVSMVLACPKEPSCIS